MGGTAPLPAASPSAEPAESARAAFLSLARASINALPTAVLPQIDVSQQMRDVLEAAWEAVSTRAETYATSGGWAQIVSSPGRPDDVYIRVHTEATASALLAQVATWTTNSGSDTFPPGRVAKIMCEMAEGNVPPLRTIVHSPFVRSDGHLVSDHGYDAPSAKYLALPKSFIMTPVPEHPTGTEIASAVALISEELMRDFPFASQADRAHAFSAMLTPLVRDCIDGPTPLHLFEAPRQGTGKSLLAEVIMQVVVGDLSGVKQYIPDEIEMQKNLVSILVEAPSAVLFDNVTGRVESAALAAALSERVYAGRYLGQSRMVRLPTDGVTWYMTGNNAILGADYPRRTVRVRLDAHVDSPHLRKNFRHKLPVWAIENRSIILAALFTMVRGWQAAGCPPGGRTRGRYESWAAIIGGILDVAGVVGFLDTDSDLQSAEIGDWRALVAAWWEQYQNHDVTVADVLALALRGDLLLERLSQKRDRGQITAMGKMLKDSRDQVFGEHAIVLSGQDPKSKKQLYALQQTTR